MSIFGCPGASLLHRLFFFSLVVASGGCSLVGSVWASHRGGFSCAGAWALGCTGFSHHRSWTLEHRISRCGTRAKLFWCMWGSCLIRDRTRVSYSGRQILHLWATREAQHTTFMFRGKAGNKPATPLHCLLRLASILPHMPLVLSIYLKTLVTQIEQRIVNTCNCLAL